MTDISKSDYQRYFKEEGDPDFSPARNKAIIEKTIRKTDRVHQQRQKDFDEELSERAEAIYAYIRNADTTKVDKPFEEFLGDAYFRELRGERRLRRLHRMAREHEKAMKAKEEKKVYLK